VVFLFAASAARMCGRIFDEETWSAVGSASEFIENRTHPMRALKTQSASTLLTH